MWGVRREGGSTRELPGRKRRSRGASVSLTRASLESDYSDSMLVTLGSYCWTPTPLPPLAVARQRVRCGPVRAQEDDLPDFDFLPPGFRDIVGSVPGEPAKPESTSGARAQRNEVAAYAKSLGAEKGYAAVEDFVNDHLPASGQPGQRRRKKEWNPSKRKPHKKDLQRRRERGTADESGRRGLSHAELLSVARPALEDAASSAGLELVGVVLMRPPQGPTPSAFRCWIAPGAGLDDPDAEVVIAAEDLRIASLALRDTLWRAVAGKPAISVMAVASGERSSRPLFAPEDFERFRGRRVQLTFREAVDGRRRLTGELLGLESSRPEPCALVQDESSGSRVCAPLSKLLYGEKTALLPPPVMAPNPKPARNSPKRKSARDDAADAADAALEAKLREMIEAARSEPED